MVFGRLLLGYDYSNTRLRLVIASIHKWFIRGRFAMGQGCISEAIHPHVTHGFVMPISAVTFCLHLSIHPECCEPLARSPGISVIQSAHLGIDCGLNRLKGESAKWCIVTDRNWKESNTTLAARTFKEAQKAEMETGGIEKRHPEVSEN